MTDNKVDIEVGIEASLSGLLQRVLQDGVKDAAEIERRLAGVVSHLQKIQQSSKMLGAATGLTSRGAPTSQIINANTSGQNADRRATERLIQVYERVARELGSGASEARLKRAFREALVAEKIISAPTSNSSSTFNRQTLPLFQRAQQAALEKQTDEWVRIHEKAALDNMAFNQRRTEKYWKQREQAERENFKVDSERRRRAETAAQKNFERMMRVGGLDAYLARGDATSANNLITRGRNMISGRRGVDDAFVDGLVRNFTSQVEISRGVTNLRKAEAEIADLFRSINRIGDQAERLRVRGAAVRNISQTYGVSPGVLDSQWDEMEARRARRMDILPPRADVQDRPRSSRLGRLAGRMQLFGDYAAIGAVVGSAGYTAYQVAELEKALATLKAISGATNGQMTELSKTIKDVGQNSSYSLREIAQGATTLAQAGYTVSEVAKVLPDITNLALASGSELQTSIDIFSSVLTVFDMNLAESSYVADVLTQALNGSKLSMDQFALGIQYAGNAAAQGGVSFEELTAALGAMSNAGIRSGSTLGTGLTALLQDLQAPSEKFRNALIEAGLTLDDVDLKTHGLVDVLDTLQKANIDSTKGFELFETRAARAYSALLNNQDVLKFMSENFSENGAAAVAAAGQMDTLVTQLTRLGNAAVDFTSVFGAPVIETLKAVFGGLADLLTALAGAPSIVRATTSAVVTLSVATAVMHKQLLASAGAAAAFTTGGILAAFTTGLTAVRAAVVSATVSLRALSIALLTTPVGWLVTGLSLLVGAISLLTGSTEKARNAAEKFKEVAAEEQAEAEELATTIDNLNKFTEKLINYKGDLADMVSEAERKFARYGLELSGSITKTNQLAEATRQLTRDLEENRRLRLEAAQGQFEQENRELQKIGRDNVNRAVGILYSLPNNIANQISGSREWKAYVDGDQTPEEIRRLTTLIDRLGRENPESARRLGDVRNAVTGDGRFLVDLDTNTMNRGLNQVSLDESRVLTSKWYAGGDGFSGAPYHFARLADRLRGDLQPDGRLSAEDERKWIQDIIPQADAFIEDLVGKIAAETGLDPSMIREIINRDPNMRNVRGYTGNPEFMSDDRLNQTISSLETQYRSTAPQNRAGILTRAEEAWRIRWNRQNPNGTALEEDAAWGAYSAERFQDPLTATQSGRTYNTALEAQRDSAYAALEQAASGTPVLSPSGRIIRPIAATAGSPFGMRNGRMHNGTDYPAATGTSVVAPLGGIATAGYDENNGNFVRIRHDNGMESMLIHLSQALETIGTEGIRVEAGDLVGYSGNTGASRGPHLHWQLKDSNGNPIDPETMVGQQAGGVSEVMQRSMAEMEARWAEYEAAERALFAAESSEAPENERAYGLAQLETRLAREREKFFQEDAGAVYKAVLDYLQVQIEDGTSRALRAISTGDATAADQVAGVKQLLRDTMAIAIEEAERTIIGEQERSNAVAAITRDYTDRITSLTIGALEAETNRVAREFEDEARIRSLGYARAQGSIDARSNPNASRNGSRAYDVIRSRDQEYLNEQKARDEVEILQAQLTSAQLQASGARTALQEAITNGASEAKITEATEALQEAETSVKELEDSLARANIELEILTAQAFEFASPIEALQGAFAAFVEQANLSRPIFNTLADGLLETFDVARGGFKTLVMDVVTGTKSMGDAFRDFALSVLQSLLDLAAEILAQEILKMIIGMFLPGFGQGTLNGLGAGASSGSVSGFNAVRRAQGGPAPNRDGALALLEPGEFVMSKTATDFIGRDTLSRMNASGNRRMSSMGTVAQATRREPDEVNVWVVSPDMPRPTGKKDIVAAISQDLLENGQTRRLIKAIQVGAL